MEYLSRPDAILAIKKMQSFHNDLTEVMSKNGFNLLENLGRRNILMSSAQEKYFADVMSDRFKVRSDGRTGEPDIYIEDLDRELECKLTSPHTSGTIAFQTDYQTLSKKKSLDYLYVVADSKFEKFAVVHYTDLNIKDFRPLSNGSRGKTQMKKYSAHDRARVLLGNFVSINEKELKKLKIKLKLANTIGQKKKIKKSIEYWKNTPTKFKIEMEKISA